MKTAVFNFMVMVMCFIGCKENVSDISQNEEPSPLYKHSILPLALNNKWAYVDSSFYTDGKVFGTTLAISRISTFKRESNQDWWVLNYDNGVTYDFTVVHDTVYMKSTTNGLPGSRIEYLPSNNTSDTILFKQTAPYNGEEIIVKVYLYDGVFSTPAGLFDTVYVYDSYRPGLEMRALKYFKPQIGPLGYDLYWPGKNTGLSEKSRLVYYNLIK